MKCVVTGSWAVFLFVLSCLVCGRAEVPLSSSYLEGLSTLAKALQTPKFNESGTFVIATAVNFGYLHHLHNFDCFMKQLELPYLVFALDGPTHANLTSGINRQLFHSIYLQLPDEADTSMAASEFRTLDFNIITARKTIAVLSLLRLGMDVLFLDADVALLRDPRPYLFWNNVQYVHSLNYPCDSVYVLICHSMVHLMAKPIFPLLGINIGDTFTTEGWKGTPVSTSFGHLPKRSAYGKKYTRG